MLSVVFKVDMYRAFAYGHNIIVFLNVFQSTLLCLILLLHLVSSEAGKKRMIYCSHFVAGKRKHAHNPNQPQAGMTCILMLSHSWPQ